MGIFHFHIYQPGSLGVDVNKPRLHFLGFQQRLGFPKLSRQINQRIVINVADQSSRSGIAKRDVTTCGTIHFIMNQHFQSDVTIDNDRGFVRHRIKQGWPRCRTWPLPFMRLA